MPGWPRLKLSVHSLPLEGGKGVDQFSRLESAVPTAEPCFEENIGLYEHLDSGIRRSVVYAERSFDVANGRRSMAGRNAGVCASA